MHKLLRNERHRRIDAEMKIEVLEERCRLYEHLISQVTDSGIGMGMFVLANIKSDDFQQKIFKSLCSAKKQLYDQFHGRSDQTSRYSFFSNETSPLDICRMLLEAVLLFTENVHQSNASQYVHMGEDLRRALVEAAITGKNHLSASQSILMPCVVCKNPENWCDKTLKYCSHSLCMCCFNAIAAHKNKRQRVCPFCRKPIM